MELIGGWLEQRGLTCGPGCLLERFVDGTPVAFVMAHVDPADGWSSVTFMGVVPQGRGKGLGAHVQRHGLDMLRAQGGITDHDGTSADNVAMRWHFDRNGCRLSAHRVELEATLRPT